MNHIIPPCSCNLTNCICCITKVIYHNTINNDDRTEIYIDGKCYFTDYYEPIKPIKIKRKYVKNKKK